MYVSSKYQLSELELVVVVAQWQNTGCTSEVHVMDSILGSCENFQSICTSSEATVAVNQDT